MFNLKMIWMIRYSLSTGNIDVIDLCVVNIEMYFHHLVPHIGQEHFNALKSVLCMEKSAVDQVITLSKSVIT